MLDISEQLVSETGTVQSRRDLSVSYGRIGDIYKAQGNLPHAMEYYKKSLEIREPLVFETGMVEDRRNLSISYNSIGDIYEEQGNLPQALEYYKKSLEIFEQLVSDTGTAESYDDLAVSYTRMAAMTTDDEQQRYLRLAYDIYCRLADACPDVQRYAKNRDIIKRYLRD